MNIVTVEYRRLRTYGDYQNETVGAVAQVQVSAGETADDALYALRTWVDAQLGSREEQRSLQSEVDELRWKKENLERQFEIAGKRWEALMTFLDKIGVKRPDGLPETLESLPF